MFSRTVRRACLIVSVLALVLGASSCSVWSEAKKSNWSNATGAEQYERLFWQSVKDKDWKSVDEHLAPGYALTSSSGTRNRQQASEYFRGMNLRDISIADLNVQPQAGDMVVTYTAMVNAGGDTQARRYVMSTVWQQVKRGWVAIAHSEVAAQ